MFTLLLAVLTSSSFAFLPSAFVDVKDINPNILVEARYFSTWNFVGRKVDGYLADKCILTKAAAEALSKVQKRLEAKNLSLLALDCYRPQRAVDDFVHWSLDLKDQKMKNIFYPDEPKEDAFANGYIAKKSGHSRGSTIDLTVVNLTKIKNIKSARLGKLRFQEEEKDCRRQVNIEKTGQLDMGTMYDCMDPLSSTHDPSISAKALLNRKLLVDVMAAEGFNNYAKEWWHFTLKNEPFKDQYFDFPVQ